MSEKYRCVPYVKSIDRQLHDPFIRAREVFRAAIERELEKYLVFVPRLQWHGPGSCAADLAFVSILLNDGRKIEIRLTTTEVTVRYLKLQQPDG